MFGPDSVYTPQIVVDGREALAGGDADTAAERLAAAGALFD